MNFAYFIYLKKYKCKLKGLVTKLQLTLHLKSSDPIHNDTFSTASSLQKLLLVVLSGIDIFHLWFLAGFLQQWQRKNFTQFKTHATTHNSRQNDIFLIATQSKVVLIGYITFLLSAVVLSLRDQAFFLKFKSSQIGFEIKRMHRNLS